MISFAPQCRPGSCPGNTCLGSACFCRAVVPVRGIIAGSCNGGRRASTRRSGCTDRSEYQ